MTEDFYDLLDVPPDASRDEIRKAFREQVRVYHPDHNDDDRARAQFTALKKAYDILGDPVERRAYDRMGHEDYVAKRTEGLPSADVWRSSSGSGRSTASVSRSASERTSGRTSRSSSSRSSSSSSRGSSRSSSTSSTSTASGRGSSRSTRSRRSRTTSASGTGANASATSRSSGSRRSNASSRTSAGRATAGSTDGGTATRSAGAADAARARVADLADNALVRWWRAQNLAWPLIWTSVLVYLAGLAQFASANASALGDVVADAGAIGPDPGALWTYLATGRHGVETPSAFVAGLDLVDPPLAAPAWHGALAGLVALSLALVVGARLALDRPLRERLTTDETIVVALALAVATGLVGGPLLAGAALLPLLFGVIVHRTHQLPGWSPSYLYAVGVLAPAAGLAAAAAGYDSLVGDLLAFVVVPLVAAVGLPVRVAVRRRYGR